MNNRAGSYRTNLNNVLKYDSFKPSNLPPNPSIVYDDEMIELLIKVTKEVAILDLLSSRISNMDLFVSMYIRKEALISSQIEGTQATLEDVFDPTIDLNINRDVCDVINYIKATEYAIKRLETLPLCNRLIRETHEILLSGVRGDDKSPGEFRKTQNWIGCQGSTIKNALFIPPNVQDMIEAMSEFEKYINSKDGYDIFIKTALIHYQFETIHPFLDGNGRVGRLIIILYLIDNGVLSCPSLYISFFLKKNRVEYYDRLSEVRIKGNYEQWVKFFLRAVYECAQDGIKSIDKLTDLHIQNLIVVESMGRIKNTAIKLFAYLERNPIIDINKTAQDLGLSFNSVSNCVNRFVETGILIPRNGARRNRTFVYASYLDILRTGT